MDFDSAFQALTGHTPMRWQERLYSRFVAGNIPSALDLPTGLGKTSAIAIWLIARAHGAPLPRRLVYVVDRRAVVDQATAEAEKLRCALEGRAEHLAATEEGARTRAMQIAAELKAKLRLGNNRELPISTLRGQYVDNRDWLADPGALAIIVGTVDMVGSRLLFSGYGVSRKMRPYHAGLLGADALVVLDEAHLVPPFAHLLRAIEADPLLGPKAESDCDVVPPLVFLPLSATQRETDTRMAEAERCAPARRARAPFRLEKGDEVDDTVKLRLGATKRMRLCELAEKDADRQLAEAAWDLASRGGGKFSRVVVFCNRREKGDEGAGRSALGVKAAIEALAKPDRKSKRRERQLHPVELLVGGRRVRERDTVAKRLRELGFIGEKAALDKPAFLVATAAGEVGVDIDADHMVSDLVAWERMVQRLGRVNRRGGGEAEIRVFWSDPAVKNAAAPTDAEQRALTAFRAKEVLTMLPRIEDAFDASPGALRALAERAKVDPGLRKKIDKATTPEPLRPALNRALVDAWSMTSLETHTGRPDIAPWLRGWVPDEQPQITIVWRRHLPIRLGPDGRAPLDRDGRPILPKKDIEEFFEAAPPHLSEKLETETYRLPDWLLARAQAVLAVKPASSGEDADAEADDEADSGKATAGERAEESEAPVAAKAAVPLRRQDVAALLLAPDGGCTRGFTLDQLKDERKGRDRDQFRDELSGNILVVDARLRGLKDGLLDRSADCPPQTADDGDPEKWLSALPDGRLATGFQVYPPSAVEISRGRSSKIHTFVTKRSESDERDVEFLCVETWASENSRATSINPQLLEEHESWAEQKALVIADTLGFTGNRREALRIAAKFHDEGKRSPLWQLTFRAPRDGVYAKTRGPPNRSLLAIGYRHEFGSLPWVEEANEFRQLQKEWRDLVLHVVAAHHGFARPVIGTRGCDDDSDPALKKRARDVALRFAAMQKQLGPWGLAWWEALLRAADAQASRENDKRASKDGKKPREVG